MKVIFDMDGVLLDSEQVYREGWLHAARLFHLSEEKMREAVILATGVTDEAERAIMTEAFGHVPGYDPDLAYRACRSYFHGVVDRGEMPVKEGARPLLAALKEKGIPVGLASSSPMPLLEKEMKLAGLYDFFDVIISGDMVERSKPDPEIFLKCAAALGRGEDPDTYVVEDSYNGIRAAAAAGMKGIMVPDQLPPSGEMEKLSLRIEPSLNGVLSFFRALWEKEGES
jgi:HAD superfamily hydrolase (TIGR01509 family)